MITLGHNHNYILLSFSENYLGMKLHKDYMNIGVFTICMHGSCYLRLGVKEIQEKAHVSAMCIRGPAVGVAAQTL